MRHRSSNSAFSARLKPESRASPGSVISGTPRALALPVANSISVSEVEVSLSTVIALNEPLTPFDSRACSTALRSAHR
jgi:hypothetical protein